jgi:hypothetical protein
MSAIDRITLFLWTNANGSHKILLFENADDILLYEFETLETEKDAHIYNLAAHSKACEGNVAGLLRECTEIEDSNVIWQFIYDEAAEQKDTSKMVQRALDEDAESDSDDDEPKEMTRDELNDAAAKAKEAAFYCKAAGGPFSQLEAV